jgi:hypothetical protein
MRALCSLSLILLLALLLLSRPAAAQTTGHLSVQSPPGDFVGQGQNYNYTSATGTFTAEFIVLDNIGIDYLVVRYRDPGFLHVWDLFFTSRYLGTALVPGTYPNAERAPFETAGHPGLSVSGEGRGCNVLTGAFTIQEAIYDTSGSTPRVVRFVASFSQSCEGTEPPLTGTIEINGDPLPTPTTTATATPTATVTPTSTATASTTATAIATTTATQTAVATATPTATPTASATPTLTATSTPTTIATHSNWILFFPVVRFSVP